MEKKNIVLLGASNSLMPGGLCAGLSQSNINLYNLSIGGTDIVYRIYELKKEENQELIHKADLIVLESNIMDSYMASGYSLKNLEFKVLQYMTYLYEELYSLKKKIVVLLLFDILCLCERERKMANLVMKFHKKLTAFYGFNLIDVHQKMLDTKCFKFYSTHLDASHLLSSIMYQLGKNISQNLASFEFTKKQLKPQTKAIFRILSPLDLMPHATPKYFKDLLYKDKYVEISGGGDLIRFPKQYFGYKILGVHTLYPPKRGMSIWKSYFSLVFRNSQKELVKTFRSYARFDWLYEDFFIDEDTVITYNKDNLPLTEISHETDRVDNLPNTLPKACIVNFLLVKDEVKFIPTRGCILQCEQENDFSHLIPPIEVYKDIIEEYVLKTNSFSSSQVESLGKQLSFFKSFSTAKARIQNQLPYKLGKALIMNSKNFLGYLSLPYILLGITLLHKQEKKAYRAKIEENPNLTLPPLKDYPDYNAACKEKNCFTYKLGEAFMKAHKTWYKGGYLKFYFKDMPRLKREFKARK